MRRTKEEALLTRDSLVDSALELFIENGYSNVSLHQIAESIGATRGAFYWHFKSKEEILLAICEREAAFIESLMFDLFHIKELNPDKHLEYALIGVIHNYYENKRYRDFVELTWFKMEHLVNDKVNELKTRANEYFIQGCKKIITKGVKDGFFKKQDSPLLWAVHLATIVNGIYRLYFISNHYMSKDAALSICNQFLISIKS
ncbi:MAG: TetR/AcrR family transcriptional regulator [Saprospiraceae bacterium]|nr:TetR/AcrR family transcriptional regulator [Saprospiraceae bacterium]